MAKIFFADNHMQKEKKHLRTLRKSQRILRNRTKFANFEHRHLQLLESNPIRKFINTDHCSSKQVCRHTAPNGASGTFFKCLFAKLWQIEHYWQRSLAWSLLRQQTTDTLVWSYHSSFYCIYSLFAQKSCLKRIKRSSI